MFALKVIFSKNKLKRIKKKIKFIDKFYLTVINCRLVNSKLKLNFHLPWPIVVLDFELPKYEKSRKMQSKLNFNKRFPENTSVS